MTFISILTSILDETEYTPPVFDDTIEASTDFTIANTPDYNFLGNYLQNPVSKNVVNVFRKSDGHLLDLSTIVKGNISTDEGVTLGADFTIYDPGASLGVNEPGVGYDSSGRLHFIVNVRDTDSEETATVDELYYFYSDDDGTTISTPSEITMPTDGARGAWPTGRIIENNGVLFKNYYRYDRTSGTINNSICYVLRSTDNGANWTHITVKPFNSTIYNEGDIIGLGGDNLMTLYRAEADFVWHHYFSTDNGLTWSANGSNNMGETLTSKKPPALRSFLINNNLIIAFSSYNQLTKNYFVTYGKASDLISSGSSAWNTSTKQSVFISPLAGVGYGNIIYFDNTLRAKGVHYGASNNNETTTYYFTLKTTHYQSLITNLGL